MVAPGFHPWLTGIAVMGLVTALGSYYHARKCFNKARDEITCLPVLCDRNRPSIDIGANGGNMVYFIRKHSKNVHAFEPLSHLSEHIKRRFSSGVKVYRMALSTAPGEAVLSTPILNGQAAFGLSSLGTTVSAQAGEVRTETVPVRRLDDVFEGDVAFIKIDAEGHEPEVLLGGTKTIAANRPTMLIETSERVYPGSFENVRKILEGMDYEGWFVDKAALHPASEFKPQDVKTGLAQLADRDYLAKQPKYVADFIWLPREKSAEIRVRLDKVVAKLGTA